MALIDNSILLEAIERGIVDVTTISQQVELMKRKEILDNHNQNVWQGKDGAWYTYLPDDNFKKGRRLIRKVKKQSLEDAIVDHYKTKEDSPTLKDVFNRWLDEKKTMNEITIGTYDRYKRDYDRHIKGNNLERRKIKTITEKELELFVRGEIADKNLSAKAYGNMRTIILGTFKYAKSNGFTNINISEFFHDIPIGKKAFKSQHKDVEEQVFTEEEANQIIEWCIKQRKVAYLGIVLAFQTGIREGELSALKFSDVKNGKLHIQRQEINYSQNKKTVYEVVEYTKTEAGKRKIFLTDKALKTIAMIKALNTDSEYMMFENGNRLHAQAFNNRLYRTCRKVGILERSMHKIRKTYGTTLLDANVDESLIMQQMGHSDIATTRKYYYFSNKNDDKKAMQIQKAIGF